MFKYVDNVLINAYLSLVDDEASIAAVLLALLSVSRLLFVFVILFRVHQVLALRLLLVLKKIRM